MTILHESTPDTGVIPDPVFHALRGGRPVLLVDDLGPHADCQLVFAARDASTELLALTVRHTSGFVVVALPEGEADRLRLAPMTYGRGDAPAYGVAVDAEDTGTGISATARARTIALLGEPGTSPDRFTRPGHVITYRAHDDGVLGRAAVWEAACDLVGLAGAGFAAAGACLVSERDPLRAARLPELAPWATGLGVPHLRASAVRAHRLAAHR
ncbi:3,4-dihydroxy-2-butanone-4-phosphate synthase [Prauserella cavernicola]|uniref:3,4-dihydroxy-2-butanone-4-phosphate synthase n=1 Tax=Prauserella cavernicola TaxID=2800127 RepID=A0A934QP07_9PSEU|nr:3,4-dihydroxy-2-butanone-4-phosphate synthase [Prauserella cavernicola]MBK1783497.1 3,4-dihydroxy-2-butanone-4-phosphate synthase [Prauserella cavernicola]